MGRLEAAGRACYASPGAGDGDVSLGALVVLLQTIAGGYKFLYGEGVVNRVLHDDSAARCRAIVALAGADGPGSARHATHGPDALVSAMYAAELASVAPAGPAALRSGPAGTGCREVMWALRVARFVERLFELLALGEQVGAAGQKTYAEVLAPFHGWVLRKFVSFALGLAPSRDSLLRRAGVAGDEAAAVALMRRVKEAVAPVAGRLHRYLEASGVAFDDKV